MAQPNGLSCQGGNTGTHRSKTAIKSVISFFLAIDSESRSKGYGSRAIETLKAVYPDKAHTVDFEMIDITKLWNQSF